MTFLEPTQPSGASGSLDSDRDGDHDGPYRLGWRSRANVLYVFNTRPYARLLVFRSRLQDHIAGKDQSGDTSSLASAA